MDKLLLSAMFYLITLMVIFSSFTNANRLELDCPDSSVYTPNSTFQQNLKLLLQSLSSNTSLNGGFYNSSIGDDTDRVYGQALCRGDANRTACPDCIANAVQDILKNCSSEDAIIWYDLCQIHYSSQNFFLINTGYYGKFPDSNDQRRRISDPVLLTKVLKYLMDNITSGASSDPLKFAVGEINFVKSNNIYGLAQCTRDISASYCYRCLSSASVELIDKSGALEGGIVVDSNCNVRFELQRFYNSSSISLTYPTSDEANSQLVLLHNLARPTTVTLIQECDLEDPASRPTMSNVLALLESDQSIAVPQPRQPAISVIRIVHNDESSTTNQSINGMTVSSISPR
ncbi:hypothetical protein QYF36_017030 [Acer negundo]|nr:hypothetical protein QYF36_017030 [Acer negundo]